MNKIGIKLTKRLAYFHMVKKGTPKDISEFSSKGGRASSSKLTKQERSERASLAAKARWDKEKEGKAQGK